MSMPQPAGYTVTAVAPDVQFGPNGNQIPGKRVTISTDTGYEGTLFIPSSVFGNVPVVQQLIEDEVRQVNAALAIKGTVTGS